MKSPQRYLTAILSVLYLIVLHATRQPKGASTTMILLPFRGDLEKPDAAYIPSLTIENEKGEKLSITRSILE